MKKSSKFEGNAFPHLGSALGLLVKLPGVADAGHAAVAGCVEAELLEVVVAYRDDPWSLVEI